MRGNQVPRLGSSRAWVCQWNRAPQAGQIQRPKILFGLVIGFNPHPLGCAGDGNLLFAAIFPKQSQI